MTDGSQRISASLLPEFDLEMANTRKVLERVPDADFAWKPHAKSFSMGELAGHVASIAGWMTSTLVDEGFDFAPGGVPVEFPKPGTARECVILHDEGVVSARAAHAGNRHSRCAPHLPDAPISAMSDASRHSARCR